MAWVVPRQKSAYRAHWLSRETEETPRTKANRTIVTTVSHTETS